MAGGTAERADKTTAKEIVIKAGDRIRFTVGDHYIQIDPRGIDARLTLGGRRPA